MRVLFATSEIHPLMKTGGLADVSASLPHALFELGVDIRLVMPAYADTLARLKSWQVVSELNLGICGMARLLRSKMPDSPVPLYLIEHPDFSTRSGNPYNDTTGHAWPDNAERFSLFSRACEMLALDQAMLDWQPDIVHGNDWQTGILLSLLRENPLAPPSLITIHNLAYQGVFSRATFNQLDLPQSLWRPDALEHWGEMNCLKAGLNAARKIATVSPSYAREIQTPTFGQGLDGMLRQRHTDVVGMINGIDMEAWNPQKDAYLAAPFSTDTLDDKALNKLALQTEMQLENDADALLIGMVGRMAEQKGLDVVLAAADRLMQLPIQLAILGGGDPVLEAGFQTLMLRYPGRISVRLGYNEGLAHRIEAGSDAFLMPSRFEPCGLNQLYSLRYGTPPIVHGVGGLNDTVIDTYEATLNNGTANGFVMRNLDVPAILWGVNRALEFFRQPEVWRTLQSHGMTQDFGWASGAQSYLELYQELAAKPGETVPALTPPPSPTRSRARSKA
ncbi:MAG: starch synthase [Gammaproteobacteria bacterium 28-57-27]|nr:MAG: starch synthase [Gammaproteobacteria bacterium 28-57-27]